MWKLIWVGFGLIALHVVLAILFLAGVAIPKPIMTLPAEFGILLCLVGLTIGLRKAIK